MAPKPLFFASDVAALIGRHRYRTKQEALLKYMSSKPLGLATADKDAEVRQAFARLQQDKLAMQEVQLLQSTVDALCESKLLTPSTEALQALQDQAQVSAQALQTAASTCERIACEADLVLAETTSAEAQKADTAGKTAREAVLKAAMPEAALPEVCAALDAAEQGTADAEQLLTVATVQAQVPELRPAVEKARRRVQREAEPELERLAQVSKRARSEAADSVLKHRAIANLAEAPAALQALVEQQVNKQRGTREEEQVLKNTEAAHGSQISNRNERRGMLVEETFCIAGYCDGVMEAESRIVEVKKRRNWFKLPPEYDLVQLRVYMRLFKASSGLLVESQLNGPQHRETLLCDDEPEWTAICQGLALAAQDIVHATPASIREWALSVLKM